MFPTLDQSMPDQWPLSLFSQGIAENHRIKPFLLEVPLLTIQSIFQHRTDSMLLSSILLQPPNLLPSCFSSHNQHLIVLTTSPLHKKQLFSCHHYSCHNMTIHIGNPTYTLITNETQGGRHVRFCLTHTWSTLHLQGTPLPMDL